MYDVPEKCTWSFIIAKDGDIQKMEQAGQGDIKRLVNQVLVSFPLHHFAKSCLFYQFSYSEGSRGPVSDDDRTCPDSLQVLGGGKTDNR